VNRMTMISSFIMVMTLVARSGGADCPRFRGPAGDGVFPETGLLKQWPADGPKVAWAVKGLGQGYSSATVVAGTVYVTGMDDQKQGYLFAFNLNGSPKWKTAYGPELDKRGPAVAGTRATPTSDGERAYLVTGLGKLVIFDVAKGQVLRTVDLLERFKVGQAKFGFAESVLVDGQKIVCTVGGTDASLVALDKNTGEVVWQTKGLSQGPGCCAPRIISYSGRRLIVTMLANAAVAVDPGTGEVVWQHEYPHRAGVQPNPPLYADGLIYVTSGMGAGGALLSLADTNPTATPKWTAKIMDCQMQGTVLIDGYIYGTAQSGNKGLICLEWETGKVMWNAPAVGMGVVIAADGMLYVYAQDGKVYLVKPNAAAFDPVSQFVVSEGTNEHWAHPTIANGRLYIRHGDALVAYDIKG
jgi:outer membrane protein assembly factor BamB